MASIPIVVIDREPAGANWRVTVSIDGARHALVVRDDADLDAQALAIRSLVLRTPTLGARDVEIPVVKPPPEPKQEDIDRAAFVALCQDAVTKRRGVEMGIGKATQGDVDAAIVAVKAAYKDEYAEIVARML